MSDSRNISVASMKEIVLSDLPIAKKLEQAMPTLNSILSNLQEQLSEIQKRENCVLNLVSSGLRISDLELEANEKNKTKNSIEQQIAETNFLFGYLYRLAGKNTEAKEKLDESLKYYESNFPEGHVDSVHLYYNIALVFINQKKDEKAEVNFKHALDIAEKLSNELNDCLCDTYYQMHCIAKRQKNKPAAETYLQKHRELDDQINKNNSKYKKSNTGHSTVAILAVSAGLFAAYWLGKKSFNSDLSIKDIKDVIMNTKFGY